MSTHLKIFYYVLYLEIGPWLKILLTVFELLLLYGIHMDVIGRFQLLLYFYTSSGNLSSMAISLPFVLGIAVDCDWYADV